jgi:hypothetical protein
MGDAGSNECCGLLEIVQMMIRVDGVFYRCVLRNSAVIVAVGDELQPSEVARLRSCVAQLIRQKKRSARSSKDKAEHQEKIYLDLS